MRWATPPVAAAAAALLVVTVLLYRGVSHPKFIPVDWEHDNGTVVPTGKGMLWFSLLPFQVRSEPRVIRYLSRRTMEDCDMKPVPWDVFTEYLDAVLPTGIVVLQSMSTPRLSEVSMLRAYLANKTQAHPFCLITSDGINDMPATQSDMAFADESNLTVWYTQNMAASHKKIRPIPLLLNLHSSLRGGILNTPMYKTQGDRYAAMLGYRNSHSVPPEKRIMAAFLGHMSVTHPTREEALALTGPALARAPKMSTQTLWKSYFAKYAFGISPRGKGIDCHRTWEMLFFGMIPIVPTSSIDPLFKGLPVVIVDSYHEVTLENLRKWWALHGENARDTSRFFDPNFWLDGTLCPAPHK